MGAADLKLGSAGKYIVTSDNDVKFKSVGKCTQFAKPIFVNEQSPVTSEDSSLDNAYPWVRQDLMLACDETDFAENPDFSWTTS